MKMRAAMMDPQSGVGRKAIALEDLVLYHHKRYSSLMREYLLVLNDFDNTFFFGFRSDESSIKTVLIDWLGLSFPHESLMAIPAKYFRPGAPSTLSLKVYVVSLISYTKHCFAMHSKGPLISFSDEFYQKQFAIVEDCVLRFSSILDKVFLDDFNYIRDIYVQMTSLKTELTLNDFKKLKNDLVTLIPSEETWSAMKSATHLSMQILTETKTLFQKILN